MSGGASMSRLLIMLPVMFAAQKLDGEDPMTIFYLRVAFGGVQAIGLLLILSAYLQATKLAADTKHSEKIVYVQPPPQPFADPNARKKYTRVVYGPYVLNQARTLLATTLFGLAITVALHYYRGMVVGLAIQTIMGPLTLFDNALIKCMVVGKGLANAAQDKIFSEVTKEELPSDVDIVDESGSPVVPIEGEPDHSPKAAATTVSTNEDDPAATFENVLLDTWDAGASADVSPLMEALDKSNVNTPTKENAWTALMVVAALGVKSTPSLMRHLKSLGADPNAVDAEGWNAMHWACFHGSLQGAQLLISDFHAVKLGLHAVKDREGKTPLQHAEAEGNSSIADLIRQAA